MYRFFYGITPEASNIDLFNVLYLYFSLAISHRIKQLPIQNEIKKKMEVDRTHSANLQKPPPVKPSRETPRVKVKR